MPEYTAETIVSSVAPGDVVVVEETPYRVVDDYGALLVVFDLREQITPDADAITSVPAGDVDEYVHRDDLTRIAELSADGGDAA
jgi:predicted transcriptional regulator